MDGAAFEAEVLSIARAMWPEAASSGPVMRQDRERDAEFETSEVTHLIECTIERTKSKAEEDSKKLAKRINYLRTKHPHRLCKGWFVTLHEPTADQRGVIEKCNVPLEAISLREFRKKLVDADKYLAARGDYAFGSMRDPKTNAVHLSHKYVPLEFIDSRDESRDIAELVREICGGQSLVILGDYGSGKSTTLSELFRRLKTAFVKHDHGRFPVVLNLRDHHGQTDPVEALERHARNIGYPNAMDLVRAWRAGYVDLFLDGFDEIAVVGWAGSGRHLKNIRFRSMELIRRFVQDSPPTIGLVIVGRGHYFDNAAERRQALGVDLAHREYVVSELRGESVRNFLDEVGWKRAVPEWVPTRPLLLGYLAAKGILADVVEAGDLSPAAGWHTLLDKIATREAQLEAGIDPLAVRRLIEEVAVLARGSNDGLGQLMPGEIVAVFVRVCGYEPDDRGAVLLQRLPGLGAHQTENGARVFVDRDFANAAAGSAVGRFIQVPFECPWDASNWHYSLSALGIEVSALQAAELGLTEGHIRGAINARLGDGIAGDTLVADLIALSGIEGYDVARAVVLSNVWIPELPFFACDGDLSRVTIRDSIIGELEVPAPATRGHMPTFERCEIESVLGCSRERDLPSHFIDCSFQHFEAAAKTTSALLGLDLPIGVRVGLTVLKKLYRQSGAGRREGALYRGLDQEEQRVLEEVLSILRKYDFATKVRQGSNDVWLPTRTANSRARALAILDDPAGSSDALLVPLKKSSC